MSWLNAGVRPNWKHRLPGSRNSQNSGFQWLLVILALGALAWMWWHAGKSSESKNNRPKIFAFFPVTNAPHPENFSPRTNAPSGTSAIGLPPPTTFPRPVQNFFEAQLALDRLGISSGSIDGRTGSQTRAALRAFQRQQKIAVSADLDAETKSRLLLNSPPFTKYAVSSNDLARLQPLSPTWLGKSRQTALDYETILELVAEKAHAHPALIRELNPRVDWTNVTAGAELIIPDSTRVEPAGKAAFVAISLSEKFLEAFDGQTNLLAHFPCSIAQRVEKRPIGELHVEVIAPNPNYTFNPELFPESSEARQINTKLILPPGPNNPVGVVWIGLDRPGYGMHGTPSPELVGRTESHGCFRLANWNAEYLLKLVWIGMPVRVEP